MRILTLLSAFFLFSFVSSASAQEPHPVFVGIDGEFGLKNSTSAQAIEMGARAAMDEINRSGGVLDGRPLELITRDHRSVPARGIENIKIFSQQKDLVAVLGGRFSPVILSEIDVIHELKLPMLDAWGSADGITEHGYNPSYTFRVSLRDRYAMPTMLSHAMKKGAQRIGVFVPNTGWGRSNVAAAERFIQKNDLDIQINVTWYNWGDKDFATPYLQFMDWGAQAVVMVANDLEGSLFVRYVASLPQKDRLPIISHWGVTGGNFVESCQGALAEVDFSVVQTFSLFMANPEVRSRVMETVKRLYGISNIEEVHSPVGFGHAYDIVYLLAKAINAAGSTDRDSVRDALQNVSGLVGLVRTYDQPFGPGDYDALEMEDVFMAYYDDNGVIRPIEGK